MKIGDKVKLTTAPSFFQEDIGKNGDVTDIRTDIEGNILVDVVLDGDEGPSVVFKCQLELI